MERLPFSDNSFDLIFSSLALQWANDLPATLRDFARIGRQQGLLMRTAQGRVATPAACGVPAPAAAMGGESS